MELPGLHNISLDPLNLASPPERNVRISILRLDKIDPAISGNKWFKLQFYLNEAIRNGKPAVLTFGGAWSNHLLATAACCKLRGLRSVGLVRGEQPPELSATLNACRAYGMELFFLSRAAYAKRELPTVCEDRREQFVIIDEGGYGISGATGAASIMNYFPKKTFSHILCAAGTGTMMAGLVKAAEPAQLIIGVSVLKNNSGLRAAVENLLEPAERQKDFMILHDYHFGGYAKSNCSLFRFMNECFLQHQLPTDFVYTGKLIFAVQDLLAKNYFPDNSNLLLIHSGGLQGNNSLPEDTLIF